MNDTQQLVKIVGMFENESAAGNRYFVGVCGGVKYLLFRNRDVRRSSRKQRRLPMRKKISVKAWNLVLATLAAGATIEGACKVAGVSRRSAQRKRQTDPDFAEAWEEAMEAGTDALEDEAVRRAKDGYIKPVFHQGVKVGEVREYSDVLLMFMLKARPAGEVPGSLSHRARHDLQRQSRSGIPSDETRTALGSGRCREGSRRRRQVAELRTG
jgi:hypothetical protein